MNSLSVRLFRFLLQSDGGNITSVMQQRNRTAPDPQHAALQRLISPGALGTVASIHQQHASRGSMPKKVDRTVRREAFLAAAYSMIKKHGISGVTARGVAAEAGFTTGALVHYVKSMDRSEEHTPELQSRFG